MPDLFWLDLETTGLDCETDSILELAAVVTDFDLNIVDELHIVVNQSDEVLKSMSGWCINQHTKSGLVDEVKKSTITMGAAYEHMLKFINQYCLLPPLILCGNSIDFDFCFLKKQMPDLVFKLRRNLIDVSSLRVLVNAYNPNLADFKKLNLHRAVSDIKESIAELRYYRDNALKPKS